MSSDNDKKDKNENVIPLNTDDFSTDGSDLEFDGDEPQVLEAEAAGAPEEDESVKLKEELLYLKAEFDNFKKRSIKERSDLIKYGPERLAIEVISALDIFEMALSTEVTPENLSSFKEGMEMTHSQLQATLKKFGIEELTPLGEPFDPNFHEALSNMPTDEYEEGQVCQVYKKGYKFFDKMIRPAQVVVAQAPAQ